MKLEHIAVPAADRAAPPVTAELAPNPNLPGACREVSSILSRIGDKWTVLVVMMLAGGPRRFNDLKRSIGGVSQRMLTLTLRGLERDGMVTRTLYPTIPPRVEYELTELGQSLREPVDALGSWAFAHLPYITAARAAFDTRHDAAA
ncbi:MAG: helix-turn-helix domain-containing protein [Sphingomicrobium sp.]